MMGRMDEDPLATLGAQYKAAVKRHKAAVDASRRADKKKADTAADADALRKPLQVEIVKAVRAGRRPKEITSLTSLGPERIRQILRDAGVEPLSNNP